MGHDRVLAATGGAGLLLGFIAVSAGQFGGEFGQLLTGYGLLVLGAAAYLLVGLSVRWLFARRARPMSGRVRITAEPRA